MRLTINSNNLHSTILIIFLLKFIAIEAACNWNGATPECKMTCTDVSPNLLNEMIETVWNKGNIKYRDECRVSGIWLNLGQLPYLNGVIDSNCFAIQVKVLQLDVNLLDVKNISIDGFVSHGFRTVKKIKFTSILLDTIRNGTFNGLDELELIHFKGANIVGFENGVLNSLTQLVEFTLEESAKSNPEISINGLTGSATLSNLENVKFKYKLTNSISEETFTGLTSVKILDLSNCQIQSIGANSFHPVSNTIEQLFLNKNQLTTITSGLFDLMLPKDLLVIYIDGHKWNCFCELSYFRVILEQFEQNFNGSIKCSKPAACAPATILESNCFDGCIKPSTSTTTKPTATANSTSIAPDKEYFEKQCYKSEETEFSDIVSVSRPLSFMTITETKSGEVNLNIENERGASFVLIWFGENQDKSMVSVEDVNCISQIDVTSIPFAHLMENLIYSFCLMDTTNANLSPLDCISYTKRKDDSVWIFEHSKTLTIGLIVGSLIMSVTFGIGIGIVVLNYTSFTKKKIHKSKHLTQPKQSVVPNDYGMIQAHRTTDSENGQQKANSLYLYEISAYHAPPLPKRPPSMNRFEEPIYATVDDIYKMQY